MKKLLLTAVIAASFSNVVLAKDLVIGAAISTFSDKFPTYMVDSMKEFDEKHDDVEFVFTDANNDVSRLLNNVETFIEQGVSAVILHPIDQQSVRPIAKKLKRAGIPLVIVNRRPLEKDMDLVGSYVGSNEIVAGRMQGEFIAKALDGKEGRVGILEGWLGSDGQVNRTAGNKEIFDKNDNISVLAEQEGKWDRAEGLKITEDWLQTDKKLNVIASNNDEMAIGALLAAQKAGLKDEDLIIVGVDATPDALEYLGKGLDATVFQDAVGQGISGAEAAYKLAKGEAVEKNIDIPFQLVTPENMDKFIKK